MLNYKIIQYNGSYWINNEFNNSYFVYENEKYEPLENFIRRNCGTVENLNVTNDIVSFETKSLYNNQLINVALLGGHILVEENHIKVYLKRK